MPCARLALQVAAMDLCAALALAEMEDKPLARLRIVCSRQLGLLALLGGADLGGSWGFLRIRVLQVHQGERVRT